MELSPYYEKKIECLFCKKTFPSTKIRSKFVKVGETDTDFMPIYEGNQVQAMYYNVFVCEHCGFSFTEDFSKYFAPGVAEELKKEICDRWVPHGFAGERTVFQAIQAYKLGLLCADIKKERFVTKAGLSLRLGWMYRTLQNQGQERRFIEMARNFYMESFSTEDYANTQMSSVRVMYMIAELSRRIDDMENATRFFSKVIESQRNGGEPKLIEMAKERWEDIRAAREALAE